MKDSLKTIFYAILIALLVRTAGYEPFNIPSGSMKPTLLVGDYLFVSKYSYGYSRHSLPLSLPLFSGRIFYTAPERGDVAVFKLPSDDTTDYIKRLIGLPGDRIQVKGGILHINGIAVKRERVEDYIVRDPSTGSVQRTPRFIETLPNGKTHYILEYSDTLPQDNTPEYTVPEGHYFAMGDNRDRSSDSRFDTVGPIPIENLVGRAEFTWFSVDGAALEFWNWSKTLRVSRFFSGID